MLLLAPDVRAWLPEGHFAHHVSDLVDGLDLTALYAPYEGDGRRNAPYEPRMMVKVLLYGYATGVFSSRGIARKLEEDVAFRVLGAGNFPSHRTLCEFRRRHLDCAERGGVRDVNVHPRTGSARRHGFATLAAGPLHRRASGRRGGHTAGCRSARQSPTTIGQVSTKDQSAVCRVPGHPSTDASAADQSGGVRVRGRDARRVEVDETTCTEWDAGRRDGECGRRAPWGTSRPDAPEGGLPPIRSSDGGSPR